MLKINNLQAKTSNNKTIINNLDLSIKPGEIHVIMGPNGSGKSTLAKVLMGHYDYKVTKGDIFFNNEKINDLPVEERSLKGIFLTMQAPTSVEGVTNSEFLRTALNERQKTDIFSFMKEIESNVNDLNMELDMIHRPINKDFSGGERKKNEILQLKMLKPKLIVLDEIDSGLDVDSLNVVMKNINDYRDKNKDVSLLIITHYTKILEYIKPDYVHLLKKGTIKKTGDLSLAKEIDESGYKGF